MSYPSRAHGFIPGFWWSPCLTLREHMGSSPGFGEVHVLPFASTWVHPPVLVESMSYPSRAHGFIPGFWWSPCLTLREHMGLSPGFGGVHVLPFASTWVHPRVLVESMSYPSRAHGFIPGFWWSPCLTLREHMGSSPGFGGVHVLPFASTWVHPQVLVESMSYPSRAHGFIHGFWWSPCLTLREDMGSSPGFGGVHVLPFASTWVHPRVLVESMSYPSRAHGFIPGFWWSQSLTLREHMGSSPGFGGVHVLPFASTRVHPRVLVESMSYPSRAHGFIPGFWWSPCLTLREHMGSSPGFGGVHILPFASTWVHPRVLVESMSYPSRAHGFIPGFWWSPCLTLREHMGSSPGFGGVHILPFASTWVHPRVLVESMSYPSRAHGFIRGFWWSPCLTLREYMGSSPGFGGVHVLPFASTWVHLRVLVESMSYPSRVHGFIRGFWWSPCCLSFLFFVLCCVFVFCLYLSGILYDQCCQCL